jgi:hypothetical protein
VAQLLKIFDYQQIALSGWFEVVHEIAAILVSRPSKARQVNGLNYRNHQLPATPGDLGH